MKNKKLQCKPPKPPKIPRCLCRSWLDWILQIASPSLCVSAAWYSEEPEVLWYFEEMRRYKKQWIEWKIALRTCTREEWHTYRRYYQKEENI